MKLGFVLANFTLPGGPVRLGRQLTALARDVEQAGFESLWVTDHFFQIGPIGPPQMDTLEAFTCLGYMAAATRTIGLGTLVAGCGFRTPELLIRAVASLDLLSGGRARLGLGTGWFEREHRGLGVDFPTVQERFEKLEECLHLVRQMGAGRISPFSGRHHVLNSPLEVPRPLQQPHPPILIGGMGERRTLALVARYAQACNLYQSAGPLELKRKLAILRQHCESIGRDYDSLQKTTLGVFYPDQASAFLEELHQLAELGFDLAIVGLPLPTDRAGLEILARDIMPRAARW